MNRTPASVEIASLPCIRNGAYCRHLADFDEPAFLKNWHLPFFLVFGFLRRYVKLDHSAASGDLVMSMVASEIWLFNIGRRLGAQLDIPDAEELAAEEKRRQLFPKCNAHSISLGLGLSPETVRRKVKKLVALGWVERARNGDLHVTAACEAAFTPQANLETMRDFISTARLVFRQLGIDQKIGEPVSKDGAGGQPAENSTRKSVPRKLGRSSSTRTSDAKEQ